MGEQIGQRLPTGDGGLSYGPAGEQLEKDIDFSGGITESQTDTANTILGTSFLPFTKDTDPFGTVDIIPPLPFPEQDMVEIPSSTEERREKDGQLLEVLLAREREAKEAGDKANIALQIALLRSRMDPAVNPN